MKYSTLKKGVKRGCIRLTLPVPSLTPAQTASIRAQEDVQRLMGKACSNVVERASLGSMSCPVEFKDQIDLQYAGVLVTLPALLACGLFKGISRFDLSKVYYSTKQIFLSLAFMVMLRVKQIEQSRFLSCGELGRCLGMDRIPCAQTLRNRLCDFTQASDAGAWSLEMSRHWMEQEDMKAQFDGALYVDGHVNVYCGKSIELPKRYVSRMRLCLSGTTDYWVNGAIGQPYFVVHKTVNENMTKVIEEDIIPELDKSVPGQPDAEALAGNPLLHRYMMVFDRECYSVPFFVKLKEKRIAFCTYRKNVKDRWDEGEFREYEAKDKSGEKVRMKLAERGVYLTTQKEKDKPQEGIWVREVRKLNASGHQTAIITTHFSLSITDIGIYMFARWSQENYLKYATESFGIDCLISNVKSSIPDTYTIPNPSYLSLCQEHKSIAGKLARQKQKLAEKVMAYDRTENEEKQMEKYLRQKSDILQTIELYQSELDAVKLKKKDEPKRVDIRDVDPEKELLTVSNDQKQLMDTVKMIGYRAETALANQIKPHMKNPEQARTLIRNIYQSHADLKVDLHNKRLCVLLHNSNSAAEDNIIRELFEILNQCHTVFPDSDLTMYYSLVSDNQ